MQRAPQVRFPPWTIDGTIEVRKCVTPNGRVTMPVRHMIDFWGQFFRSRL